MQYYVHKISVILLAVEIVCEFQRDNFEALHFY